jgi:monoamine oxidase
MHVNELETEKNMLDVAIFGGGLSGLALAHTLYKNGFDFRLYEARERFGGRILSCPDNNNAHRFDLGPSWVWPEDQPLIANFIQQYGLNTFEQWNRGLSLFHSEREHSPQSFQDPSIYAGARRLEGGSQVLIECLVNLLPQAALKAHQRLNHLEDSGDHIKYQITDSQGIKHEHSAQHVAIMIPPRLVAQHLTFEPPLDPHLLQIMQGTPTWMASHAKAVLHYSDPFWRQQGLSGSAFANYAGCILGEIFDSSSADGSTAALAGFFALPATTRQAYRDDLETLITEQMVRLFGAAATRPLHIYIHDWCTEVDTATHWDIQPPVGHPSYGHRVFQLDHWNDKLFFGGSETATQFGGYLEGALQSAHHISQQLLSNKGAETCQTT